MQFYLGTHRANWLSFVGVPLFVSRSVLRNRRSLPRAAAPWALDSGGFTELTLHGGWRIDAATYASDVRRYASEIGNLNWAAPQDWMCEPHVIAKTGLTVFDHQVLTTVNFLELRTVAPELPFIPVLQGWEPQDYLDHVDLYERHGVDLSAEPTVGVGSVCRRSNEDDIARLLIALCAMGISLHGFGIKNLALRKCHRHIVSSDSMAWSFRARRDVPLPGCQHTNCANCVDYALLWRQRLLVNVEQSKGTL